MARTKRADPAQADATEPGMIEFVEIDRESESEEADTRWLIQHYSELVREYPMSWVAIQDQQVVGQGSTPNRAMQTAIEALDARPQEASKKATAASGATGEAPRKHAPHLYFLERSADWMRED